VWFEKRCGRVEVLAVADQTPQITSFVCYVTVTLASGEEHIKPSVTSVETTQPSRADTTSVMFH
jgi:hypothetical protein